MAPVDERLCRVTRTSPDAGFVISTMGGANALRFSGIAFNDTSGVEDSPEPLVSALSDGLGSGSEIKVDGCEFVGIVGGVFAIKSFKSDAPGPGSSVFDVRSSVFANNTGVGTTAQGAARSGVLTLIDGARSSVSISDSSIVNNTSLEVLAGAGTCHVMSRDRDAYRK